MANEIFLSYTSIKDLYGTVGEFQERLQHEVRMKSGDTDISIFQDKKNLRFGDNFKEVLEAELENVKVLIILLSPTWLNSKWCTWEYKTFKKDPEKRVIVVKWDEIDDAILNDESLSLYNELVEFHYVDWVKLKYADWESVEEKLAAAKLAKDIVAFLNNPKKEPVKTVETQPKPTLNDTGNTQNNFEAISTELNNGNIQVYKIKHGNKSLTYNQVLDYWETDIGFADFYISIFRKCGYYSYVWESPPLSSTSLDQEYEFVIINAPISSDNPDSKTYKPYFSLKENDGIVCFPNLGNDALLIVPSPVRKYSNYSNLANFFKEATREQQRSIWKVTARKIKENLSDKPTWVSVAGGGISWLHIRLDTIPKYYRYLKYTE